MFQDITAPIFCFFWQNKVNISSKYNTFSYPIPLSSLTDCLNELKSWFSSNFLKPNSEKFKFPLTGTKSTQPKAGHESSTVYSHSNPTWITFSCSLVLLITRTELSFHFQVQIQDSPVENSKLHLLSTSPCFHFPLNCFLFVFVILSRGVLECCERRLEIKCIIWFIYDTKVHVQANNMEAHRKLS